MPPYALARPAQDDLRAIARYTLKEWGKAQSLRYAASLERCFLQIAARTVFSRPLFERYPELRVSRCEHHYVFYLQGEDRPPRIIAVLHEKMDMLARLKNRLP
jgi:toxin ParE1/3/4